MVLKTKQKKPTLQLDGSNYISFVVTSNNNGCTFFEKVLYFALYYAIAAILYVFV